MQRRIQVFADFIGSGDRGQRLLELDERGDYIVRTSRIHSINGPCYVKLPITLAYPCCY